MGWCHSFAGPVELGSGGGCVDVGKGHSKAQGASCGPATQILPLTDHSVKIKVCSNGKSPWGQFT